MNDNSIEIRGFFWDGTHYTRGFSMSLSSTGYKNAVKLTRGKERMIFFYEIVVWCVEHIKNVIEAVKMTVTMRENI